MAARQAVEGTRVWIKTYPEDKIEEGVVVDTLSTQFVIRTDDGRLEFCFFGDDWGEVDGT